MALMNQRSQKRPSQMTLLIVILTWRRGTFPGQADQILVWMILRRREPWAVEAPRIAC